MMTGVIGVAEYDHDMTLLAERILSEPVSHEKKLFLQLQEILNELSITLENIDGIIIGIGPGSFTGLRVGLAAAKGMALSLDVPLAGVSSLEVLQQSVTSSAEMVVPLIDARRGEIYGQIQDHVKPTALSPDDWCTRLCNLHGPFLLVGDGAERYGSFFLDRLTSNVRFGPRVAELSRGKAMAHLGIQCLRDGGDDLASLVPQYLRVSDAEIGFRRHIDSTRLS